LLVLEERTAIESRTDAILAGREASEVLQAALARLSPELRETVILRDLEELEYRVSEQLVDRSRVGQCRLVDAARRRVAAGGIRPVAKRIGDDRIHLRAGHQRQAPIEADIDQVGRQRVGGSSVLQPVRQRAGYPLLKRGCGGDGGRSVQRRRCRQQSGGCAADEDLTPCKNNVPFE
jgi:hypothetical protein